MRSALLCVFFALAVGKGGRQAGAVDDFRPMPIPLDTWHGGSRARRVGTLHEAVNTEAPPSVAAVPAHYWEDALRHSVYLTLVRDKIDQLIAKGAVISPDTKPDQFNSKEVEDHDLWDKIKSAPFDRISENEPNSFGDVTVMAKGRLLEENNGFRFTEDERTNEKCKDDSCMKGVKAIWSVKRVRQRDEEVSPGKYHYELTFSVMSQTPKKQRQPYENSVRTFTVRENPTKTLLAKPQPKPYNYESVHPAPERPQRAIWFHRNLVSSAGSRASRYQGLDRLFMSLFSDDEPQPEPPRVRPPIYQPHQQIPNGPYASSSTEQYQQKKLMAYPYKPPVYKYVRHPLPPPVVGSQPHFMDPVDSSYISTPVDQRYVAPSNVYKTTRPAVLPTPLPDTILPTTTKNVSYDLSNSFTETSTRETEPDTPLYKTYNKPKPIPTKISYFPDHLRPPVYNAPPGVFVTMDKKPFKPLPPLKIHTTKYKHRHGDFRPSPQLFDMQFSDPETHSTVDTAFRPILINLPNNSSKSSSSANNKKGDKQTQKSQTTKRPPKKHGNIKSKPVTTSAPDIITVNNDSLDDDTAEWAKIVGSFSVTTQNKSTAQSTDTEDTTEREQIVSTASYEDETVASSTIPVNPSQNKKKRVITTTTTTEPTTTKLSRRTRPPPMFNKPEKPKKHKRITTTTMKTPTKSQVKSPAADLTPQASSAATKPNKIWEAKNKTVTTTESSNSITPQASSTSSTTTTRATTTTTTTTTTVKPVTTTDTYSTHATTQPKNKNRFRQSTLMQKGTSVNHDKWSTMHSEKDRNKTVIPPSGKFPPRRKGSNFQGHATSTSRSIDVDHKGEDHTDKKINSVSKGQTPMTTQPSYEEVEDQYNTQNQHEEGEDDIKENPKEHGSESDATDEKEYIFDLTTTPNERTNEISDAEDSITEEIVTTPIYSVPKNKTKCKKKKKHENLMTMNEPINETTTLKYEPTTVTSSTEKDIFQELFGEMHYDDTTEKNKESPGELEEEGSEKHEKFAQIDDDFQDYIDDLTKSKQDDQDVDQYEEEDESENESPIDFSPYDNESEDTPLRPSREAEDDEYEDYHERSLSFLELMAME
ncbi:mucin-5AC-like [Amyelois transitella]|uniref:mucin-5AC-like n=1 Tax=Amyelois transitella TaxID=680683 RepID=UPI00298F7F65|nr:mucin-5AC-like [Amyelois transitella]